MKDKELNEVEFIEKLGDALEQAHAENKENPECPEGQRFGIRLALPFPYITECGCWDEAIWPAVLSFGGGKLIGSLGARSINKYLLKKTIINSFDKTWEIVRASVKARSNIRKIVDDRIIRPMGGLKKIYKRLFGMDISEFQKNIIDKVEAANKQFQELGAKIGKRAQSYDNPYIEELFTNKSTKDILIQGLVDASNQIKTALSEIQIALQQLAATIDNLGVDGVFEGISSKQVKEVVDALSKDVDLINDDLDTLIKTINDVDIEANVISDGLTSLFGYVNAIASYMTVVIPKECSPLIIDETVKNDYEGPFDPKISGGFSSRLVQIIDSIYFQGQWKGSKWDGSIFFPTIRNTKCGEPNPAIAAALGDKPSWEKIRQVLIDNKLPIWPSMNEDCACVDCPEGYGLCTTAANLPLVGSDSYNICLPICGGQVVKPSQNQDAITDTLTKSNCDIGCPEGYEWVNCDSSDCDRSDCKDGSDVGFCVKTPEVNAKLRNNDINPQDYGPLIWDRVSCRWVCRNGVWVMDWGIGDPSPPNGVNPEDWYGEVYVDDPRFDEEIYLAPGGPGGVGQFVKKYKFRGDRFEIFQDDCEEGQIRSPENDCNCTELTSSGFGFDGFSFDEFGLPELPEGFVLFDEKLIKIEDVE